MCITNTDGFSKYFGFGDRGNVDSVSSFGDNIVHTGEMARRAVKEEEKGEEEK